MRKHFLIPILALIVVNTIQSQTRGTKIGYIDMEYILQNVPNYIEANVQLEQKAQKWKQEIESKKIEIDKIKEALKAEKALLTKGLIEEREIEIKFLENEMLDFQQKRFGPYGLLMTQKSILVKPIQDQVFTAVQDIAETKKYDFIFDKSSDLTMLFSAKRFDLSDQVLRVLNRAEKREEQTKKQIDAEDAKESKDDADADNPELAERQKVLEERKNARDKIIADRKLAQEEKKQAAEQARQKIIDDREAKKNGTVSDSTATDSKKAAIIDATEAAKLAVEEAKQNQNDARAKVLEDRKKVIEDRKRAVEERRVRMLEVRDSIKKSKEDQVKLKQ
ncbi:OmpH family outer membrane protein [Flavobacterium sp. W22_SRS_FP1]|uniref:OmpH family outer membrane protein n=1 Tax=Flavobacterium sp. W22_SRS_FP1 TaxID=3240276 RepID=UPI003F92E5F4